MVEYIILILKKVLSFSKLISVFYRGVTYNSGNPGPSGWSQSGVETDFGLRFDITNYPFYSAALGQIYKMQ